MDGQKEGKEVRYFENGQVKQERHYVDGKSDGKWVFYDENGKHADNKTVEILNSAF